MHFWMQTGSARYRELPKVNKNFWLQRSFRYKMQGKQIWGEDF
jgi:hypothetical protein